MYTHLTHLHLLADHNNNCGVVIPHHPPEVKHRAWQRPLSCYIIHISIWSLSKFIDYFGFSWQQNVLISDNQHHLANFNRTCARKSRAQTKQICPRALRL